jgi:hypothetical protein
MGMRAGIATGGGRGKAGAYRNGYYLRSFATPFATIRLRI